jgi:hypothetical protein
MWGTSKAGAKRQDGNGQQSDSSAAVLANHPVEIDRLTIPRVWAPSKITQPSTRVEEREWELHVH